MYNRYERSKQFINNSDEYTEILNRKSINQIIQKQRFSIDKLSNLNINNLNTALYMWKANDKIYNISQKFYGSPEFGWLIMLINNIDDPFTIADGTILKIIVPIEAALGAI